MARSALLAYVDGAGRRRARLRIVSLAAAYQASGPPLAAPPPHDFASLDDAAAALVDSVEHEDLDGVDTAAVWLGARIRPDQLSAVLADHSIDRLSAAGHANIYLQLLARNHPRGLPQQMLRHPARELAKRSDRRISLPPTRIRVGRGMPAGLVESMARVPVVGRPEQSGIAAMVEHARDRGAFAYLLDTDGTFSAPDALPVMLLRFAAQAMLQGPPEAAAYGWTHCLTLSQAALAIAPACTSTSDAVYIASVYLAAHWATLGQGRLDVDGYVPEPVDSDLGASLLASPGQAASAAWHGGDRGDTVSRLATSAAGAHDAHCVKYTLACLDAAAADPTHAPLYLAAAAYLNAWWIQHPDPSDPPTDHTA
ncbi:MAG: hypothetical protein M0Z30_13345 [Actinomycetota bacterium]|nr:hypothetical protein [Actinomycetota bacterium]